VESIQRAELNALIKLSQKAGKSDHADLEDVAQRLLFVIWRKGELGTPAKHLSGAIEAFIYLATNSVSFFTLSIM